MKNLTWQNPEQLFVAQELIKKVKRKCCGIKDNKEDIELISKISPISFPNYPIYRRKEVLIIKRKETFEWVKVRTYLTIIDGRYAFETLYRKVYH